MKKQLLWPISVLLIVALAAKLERQTSDGTPLARPSPLRIQALHKVPTPRAKLLLELIQDGDSLVVTLSNGYSEAIEVLLLGDCQPLASADANILVRQVSFAEAPPEKAIIHGEFGWGTVEGGGSITKRFRRSDVLKMGGGEIEPRIYAECEVKIGSTRTVLLSNQLVFTALEGY